MGTSARVAEPPNEPRRRPEQLAEEQAALRRVATLVAVGASSAEIFDAVAYEIGQVLSLVNSYVCRFDDEGTTMTVLAAYGRRPDTYDVGSRWPLDGPSMSAEVLRTARPVRFDARTAPGTLASEARAHGFTTVAGAPIIVDGRVWGVVATSTPDGVLPDDLEERLGGFTSLLATAISNTQAHDELTRLVDEQAALRRVATLVARGAPPEEVFEAVSTEVAALIPAEGSALTRFEGDGTVTAVSGWTAEGGYAYVGNRYKLEGTVSGLVLQTGRPARVDDYEAAPGDAPEAAREMGWHSSIGAPITVDGRLWGVLALASRSGDPLPRDAEHRLSEFTELVATAIANSQAQEELARLADEQAALRRVAMLAAKGAQPVQVFEAVSKEVADVFRGDAGAVMRYEEDGTLTAAGGWTASDGHAPTGMRFTLEGSVSGIIFETGRPARIDNFDCVTGETAAAMRDMGWRTAAGAPISVGGRLWGTLVVYSLNDEPFSVGTEQRLAKFGEIVATAIANTESHEEITRLADEQAALRRIATLVAQGAQPTRVFEAVSAEVGRLLGAEGAAVTRFGTDGTGTALGAWTQAGGYAIPTGVPLTLQPGTSRWLVYDSHRPARIDSFKDDSGAERAFGQRSSVGAPIVVEGRVWGAVSAASWAEPFPDGTEERLTQFTELLATAIANAESRAELEASRARIVATADATRRRIERDLHDGAQQRLLTLALEVRAAQAAAPPELTAHRAELSHIAEGMTNVLDGLREIALGLHPAILAEGGLGPALKTLAQRSPLPVRLDAQVQGRLPEQVEVAAYYVVSEALTNAAKYSCASQVAVDVVVRDEALRVTVGDDGVGGADPARGSGLLGLKDRVAAIDGTLHLESRPGAGTSLVAELPLGTRSS